MEVLIPDPTYDRPDRSREEFLAQLEQDLAELSSEYDLSDSDAGHGADWPVVLVSIGGLFFLGKQINENLDAWITLAKKFGAFVARLTKRWSAPRVDQNGATLIALLRVLELHGRPIQSIELVGVVPTWFQVFPMKPSNRLDHHPDALYISSFQVDDENVYVLGVKSKGTIEFEHKFSTSYLDF